MTEDDATTTVSAPAAPLLRVVSGNPTPEELAILLAVATARSGGSVEEAPPAKPRGGWGDPERAIRHIRRPGPGAWRVGL